MGLRRASALVVLTAALGCHIQGSTKALRTVTISNVMNRRLTHDETLRWIATQRAWRHARKTKPIWARPVMPEEVGRALQTADHAIERASADHWLCVGVAGEPWFQTPNRIEAKYERTASERRQFSFDTAPREYGLFAPREGTRNWAAQVDDPAIEGFYIQPNYPSDGPLYSPRGGYVVKDDVGDPYSGEPNDVWLVQQNLFESTYEIDPR